MRRVEAPSQPALLRRRLPSLGLVLIAIGLAGCGGGLLRSPGSGPDAALQAKDHQIAELRRRATVHELEVARLQREIIELERLLSDARSTAAVAEPTAGREAPQPWGTSTSGSEEPVAVATSPRIEEVELEEPPREPVSRPAPSLPPPAPPAAATASAPTLQPVSPSALELYDQGYTLFHQQDYTAAEQIFERYVTLHPATDLTDNAQFWIGECRYARGEYESALQAFTLTVERYPDGNKIADALLKAGKSLGSLGQADSARETYREVIDRFPTSAAAAVAREQLGQGG